VGRVGRSHGRDGSFYVEGADHELAVGTEVSIGPHRAVIDRRGGTDARPLVHVAGLDASDLRGRPLLVDEPLEEGEYLAADLVGCEIPGVGRIERIVNGPSCDVLEAGPDGTLVPFVADAIERVDLDARVVEVDRSFLGLGEP
jgi:16S rRNA processing protein RimM